MEFLLAVGFCWAFPMVLAFGLGVLVGQGRLRSPIAPKTERLESYRSAVRR